MLSITPFKQSDSSRCGPACIRMVLDYYKIDVTEDEIANHCGWTYEEGCDDVGIKKAIEHYGLGCSIRNECDLDDIRYWVDHHIPVIVDWFANGLDDFDMPNGHSSVVVGIDQERIHLVDPWLGQKISIPLAEFERVWFDWKGTDTIQSWEDMVIRQIIIPYPSEFKLTTKQQNNNEHRTNQERDPGESR